MPKKGLQKQKINFSHFLWCNIGMPYSSDGTCCVMKFWISHRDVTCWCLLLSVAWNLRAFDMKLTVLGSASSTLSYDFIIGNSRSWCFAIGCALLLFSFGGGVGWGIRNEGILLWILLVGFELQISLWMWPENPTPNFFHLPSSCDTKFRWKAFDSIDTPKTTSCNSQSSNFHWQ